jgi:hypothetical protein
MSQRIVIGPVARVLLADWLPSVGKELVVARPEERAADRQRRAGPLADPAAERPGAETARAT